MLLRLLTRKASTLVILEWRDVTEEREKEQEVGRLASAVKGMTTNLMMADKDGIIQYLNPALATLLKSRESDLQQALRIRC